MATKSFYEMMVINTDEKAANLVRAFEEAEKRGPYVTDVDLDAAFKRGEEQLTRLNAEN